MTAAAPTLLVVAKAPVPGRAKTRLARTVGYEAAARLAAAALLDTLDAAGGLGWPVVVAMTGDLADAAHGAEIADACGRHRMIPQRGMTFGDRLAAAHSDAASGAGVVQIGMDTPHLDTADLRRAGDALQTKDAALGPAEDGGWWVLGVRDPRSARCLADVPMSRTDTGARTRTALEAHGASVATVATMNDVDTWADACEAAALAPHTRFAAGIERTRPVAVR